MKELPKELILIASSTLSGLNTVVNNLPQNTKVIVIEDNKTNSTPIEFPKKFPYKELPIIEVLQFVSPDERENRRQRRKNKRKKK